MTRNSGNDRHSSQIIFNFSHVVTFHTLFLPSLLRSWCFNQNFLFSWSLLAIPTLFAVSQQFLFSKFSKNIFLSSNKYFFPSFDFSSLTNKQKLKILLLLFRYKYKCCAHSQQCWWKTSLVGVGRQYSVHDVDDDEYFFWKGNVLEKQSESFVVLDTLKNTITFDWFDLECIVRC